MADSNTYKPEWNALDTPELVKKLGSGTEGLSEAEAEKRRQVYGSNVLPDRHRIPLWLVVLHQFKSAIIYVLLIAAAISLLVGEYSDAGFIMLVLIINAVLGATQEWKAESSAASLRKLIKVNAKVLRDQQIKELGADELVPGDLVYLESGNKVPADIRLLQANQLSLEEALLTGESLPVVKNADPASKARLPVGDRQNMAHAGTTVMNGRGRGVVVATGIRTEIGLIASSLRHLKSSKAPLVERMERFAARISVIVLVTCIVLGVIGGLQGIPIMELFFFMIAIAVSAIPEGLPVAITVALAIGTTRMARRHVIIRKLTAVEGLGSCTYIATDKTGTLTVDQQTAQQIVLCSGEVYTVTGTGYAGEGQILDKQKQPISLDDHPELAQLIRQVILSNEATLHKVQDDWRHQGDAIDVALLALSYKTGTTPKQIRDEVEVLKEIPFEPQRRYAALQYRSKDKCYLAVKGAYETISGKSTKEPSADLEKKVIEMAGQGYRIITVGLSEGDGPVDDDQLPPLKLLGIVALMDPLRPEAKAAIKSCHEAGVTVAMLTGDHPATALSIAQQLDIASTMEEVVSGSDLGESGDEVDEAFMEKVRGKLVFARVSPFQKQHIVEALKRMGHFVAVTGDGVNDAPALRTAHIGVAMGYGTDVAKETASIIVTDDNFASIAAGIEEGRAAYSNIRKIVYLLISTGAAELVMIAMALSFSMPLPFLPVQLLWLNLVTNGIQDIGLGFEKKEKGLMKQLPRSPSEGIFEPLMIKEVLLSGITISLLAFGAWYYLLEVEGWSELKARNSVLLLMVLLENFHVFNCRSESHSVFRIPFSHNYVLIIGVFVSQGIHIVSMHIPFMQNLLSLAPVSPREWLEWLGIASVILVVMELFKLFRRYNKSQTETSHPSHPV